MNKEEATKKILRLIKNGVTKKSLANKLSITFPTLQKKIESSDWSNPELFLIESLSYD